MQEMNRREFVAIAAGACAACACGGAEAWAAEKTGPVDAGLASQYSQDVIIDRFLKTHRFFLVRHQGKLYAATAICSHRNGALVLNQADRSQIRCTQHGSVFDSEGKVLKAPAKTGLARFAIALDANKHVIVDTSKKFTQDQWEQAGSFLAV